jgi:leucyl aminopeptidase
VVLGAHYDSISRFGGSAPGADDNATGTVGVMEAARVMAGFEFERSVIFIAFSGEEQGLVGSEAWASEAASAGMNIVAMINLDMLCYLAPDDAEDLDIITDTSSSNLRNLAFNAIRTYVPDLAVVEGHLSRGSSDHASFWRNGYRAVFFFEDSESYSPYIHTSVDIVGLSANNFDFMLKNVKAAVATVASLARPLRARIEP